VPGPHRLLLGIHGQTKPAQPFGLAYPTPDEGCEKEEGKSQ
jgi:hypothetical protein